MLNKDEENELLIMFDTYINLRKDNLDKDPIPCVMVDTLPPIQKRTDPKLMRISVDYIKACIVCGVC